MEGINFTDKHVAYFSMEIGISPKIPTYSGGLGVLAGDTLRSCADLEVPVIGLTLLYKKGYFKQRIDLHGNQSEEEMNWVPSSHLKPLPNKIAVEIEHRIIKVKAWLLSVEGVSKTTNPIIFLDTDLPENSAWDRTITQHLYGYDSHYRLAQEIVLGIGGVRMLKSLGCNIQKYHMNEGHSALLALELYREYRNVSKVRKKCVFTTHTPVPAGHDQFEKAQADHVLQKHLTPKLCKEIYTHNKLNMTYLALYFSQFINGVAKKHGEVSRSMFPGYHIESITNGVHSAFLDCPIIQKTF